MLDRLRAAPSVVDVLNLAGELTDAAAEGPGSDTVRQLVAAVEDVGDQPTGIAAVHALGRVFDDEADAVLSELLSHPRPYVREHAAWVLGARLPRLDAIGRLVALADAGGFSGVLAQRTLEAWAGAAPEHVALALEGALAAARDVFLDDPKAPVAAVAERAGVGMSALYRRYPGKEDLLRQLCHDGLRRFNAEAESAAAEPDGWAALTTFLRAVVDADVHSLTVHLAGTFTSTPEMRADAQRSGVLVAELVRRAHESGTLRPDVVAEDVGLLLEGCASIRVPDPERTKQLRRRHLRLLLDGLSAGQAGRAGREDTLPGPPPSADELNWRWRRPPAS
ncbi:hypothetical protein GCM10009557_25270 [Virgisporangium ochraceum]